MRATAFVCTSLLTYCLSMSPAVAQTAEETFAPLPTASWPVQQAAEHRPHRSYLTGATWAFSMAGDAYTFSGDRLHLPGEVEGWEDDIAVGVGVFRAMGQLGHLGAGVGVGDDEDVAVRAHLAMKW